MLETKETKPSVTLPEATRQLKTVPMKWLELGIAKDPEFNTDVFLYRKGGEEHEYAKGWLKGTESEVGKKIFKFVTGEQDGEVIVESNFTHYAICKPPVE